MDKVCSFKIKGMLRDLSVSSFSAEYAYENMNVRIMPTNELTLLSMVNEKGTKLCQYTLLGIPMGLATIDKYLVIFSHDKYSNKPDKITKISIDANNLLDIDIDILYEGNLNLDPKYPIETLSFYENSDIMKVYWTDGKNLPRFINIASSEEIRNNWNDSSFDFLPLLLLKEKVNITKLTSGGYIESGVVLYAMTYFNKYGLESNIFYISPLYYVSKGDTGSAPSETTGCSFKITVINLDTRFDYIRVYLILRTTIDTTPSIKFFDISVVDTLRFTLDNILFNLWIPQVIDPTTGETRDFVSFRETASTLIGDSKYEITSVGLYRSILLPNNEVISLPKGCVEKIILDTTIGTLSIYKGNEVITYPKSSIIDDGTIGESMEESLLLYIGGNLINSGTLTQKDNTLFLGDITILKKKISLKLRNSIKLHIDNTKSLQFKYSDTTHNIDPPRLGEYYDYTGLLEFNSRQIKTFKYLEWYRFGIQLLDKYGVWSDPIWIGDKQNNKSINTVFYNDSKFQLPIAEVIIEDKTILRELQENYINVRPVIVYPQILNRSVLCLGVLCPTVYSVQDRYSNTPYAQSSWFTRPNAPFDCKYDEVYLELAGYKDLLVDERYIGSWLDITSTQPSKTPTIYSRAGAVTNSTVAMYKGYDGIFTLTNVISNLVNKGAWAEFRHNYPIPSSLRRNAEILCLYTKETLFPFVNYTLDINQNRSLTDSWVQEYNNYFFIDLSIVTLHSPDLEFDKNLQTLDITNAKLRIVGIVPITSTASDIDISTSTGTQTFGSNAGHGFYKESLTTYSQFNNPLNNKNNLDSMFGWRGLISGVFWIDFIHTSSKVDQNRNFGFVVYPWHRNGSLNNTKYTEDNTRPSMLQQKKMINLRYSYKPLYIQYPTDAYESNDDNVIAYRNLEITDAKLFNSDEVVNIQLEGPEEIGKINYYGNVDKLITTPPHVLSLELRYFSKISGENKSIDLDGYPIFVSSSLQDLYVYDLSVTGYHALFVDNKKWYITGSGDSSITDDEKTQTNRRGSYYDLYDPYNSVLADADITGVDPIRMRYKSSPHAVIALNTRNSMLTILPTFKGMSSGSYFTQKGWEYSSNHILVNNQSTSFSSNKKLFFDKAFTRGINGIKLNTIDLTECGIRGLLEASLELPDYKGVELGFLWLGELYRDDITEDTRFGGLSNNAIEQNIWTPCGDSVSLFNNDSTPKDRLKIEYTEGDTYFQRYDHLKTYPFTSEDQNQMTDIISFMCETKVNLDGRYDKNRGFVGFALNRETTNKLNEVYSQTDNYFKYRIPNPDKLNLNNFHNSITWTKTKTLGELIDSWTNVTLASTLDLDGDKGPVRSLKKFNNNLFAFQDKGISLILYNDSVLISSTQGVPIEIANSGKVSGKRYLTEVGCTNKWSICLTPSGLYFIDDITKGIYLFNGLLNNLSDKLGFHSWINSESKSIDPWNPIDFLNFVSYYDKVNGDVFFISKDKCLGFSEPLGLFVSFYNYENTPYFANIQDKGIWVKLDGTLWMHLEGEYNNFFGENKPFYTTIIANPDPLIDKTFNTVEFRADSFKDNKFITTRPFDTLKVWNEYQKGISNFDGDRFAPKNPLRLKFRMWRANIPRSDENYRDRIRNPWAYILLINKGENTNKVLLHDIVVHYFQ